MKDVEGENANPVSSSSRMKIFTYLDSVLFIANNHFSLVLTLVREAGWSRYPDNQSDESFHSARRGGGRGRWQAWSATDLEKAVRSPSLTVGGAEACHRYLGQSSRTAQISGRRGRIIQCYLWLFCLSLAPRNVLFTSGPQSPS